MAVGSLQAIRGGLSGPSRILFSHFREKRGAALSGAGYGTAVLMGPHRSTLLLILLAITPIALLAWLGTYLIRDAARSTDNAMQAILTERLAVADHHLVEALQHFTEALDLLGAGKGTMPLLAAERLAEHPWVVETWSIAPDGIVTPVANKGSTVPSLGATAQDRAPSLLRAVGLLPPFSVARRSEGTFRGLSGGDSLSTAGVRPPTLWQTSIKDEPYDLRLPPANGRSVRCPSGWHVSDRDFIYWRLTTGGAISCARIDSKELRESLVKRLPIPGLAIYPGSLTLATTGGIPLHNWGMRPPQPGDVAPAQVQCSPPLSQWVLRYTPAAIEFPKPYLFPILLGVGSGSILVLTLAWMFFNESERELRTAQQRVSFVNQISHELKTPLTNIQLYTEMASHRIEDAGDEVTKRHLSVVEAETARLNRLIQNVLNYARQQRNRLTVQPRQIVLDEVVERAVDNWRPLLERKSLAVELGLQGPPVVKADADAIEQILGNLLSNVDKYAVSGKWVGIRTETNGGSCKLIVEDRGPGIPPTKRQAVFEPFGRLRSDLNEGVSGTGIGLTISRELAELHGGSLQVCSQYRDGARFILTLPLPSSS